MWLEFRTKRLNFNPFDLHDLARAGLISRVLCDKTDTMKHRLFEWDRFDSIVDLIQYYSQNPVAMSNNKEHIRLRL